MNKVYQNLRFYISKGSVNVSNISRRIFHESGIVVIAHRNDDMLS